MVSLAAYVSFAALAVVGLLHFVGNAGFLGELDEQDLVPRNLRRLAARGIAGLELLLGLGGLASTIGQVRAAIPPLAFGAAALFGTFSCYSFLLLRLRPGTPCGCGLSRAPASTLVPIRAAGLAVASVVTAVSVRHIVPAVPLSYEFAVILLVSAFGIIALWILPDALREGLTSEL